MTAAKNGVYSWAKKALPSCKRRAEVLFFMRRYKNPVA